MNHRSVIAAVLGVGFVLAAATPAFADPWGRGGHRGHEFREHRAWGHEGWGRRYYPGGYYGYAPSPYYAPGAYYAPGPYYAPPAVFLGLPGVALRIR